MKARSKLGLLASGFTVAVLPLSSIGSRHATSTSDQVVSPPPSIASDCSVNVSKPLRQWLATLPSGTTVEPPSGACYQVDGGLSLTFPSGLTIDGGTYENLATAPPPPSGHGTPRGSPVFNVFGGSGVTFENMTIEGADPTGDYDENMAFAGGIELQGTSNANIDEVTEDGLFGDGVTLAPLRGGKDHDSGKILSPVDDVTITSVDIDGAGREGITFASVNGATVTNLTVANVGLDTFDLEADQSNEGAQNVTIDGCTSSSPTTSNYARSFFANDGLGSAKSTGNITVEDCTMTEPQGTAAVQAMTSGTSTTARGPIVFEDDSLQCGQSVSQSLLACVDLIGGNVTFDDCTLTFPTSPPAEEVYSAAMGSTLEFSDDDVTGFGSPGTEDSTSTVTVTGGTWTAAG